jgi:hypothetical protein
MNRNNEGNRLKDAISYAKKIEGEEKIKTPHR